MGYKLRKLVLVGVLPLLYCGTLLSQTTAYTQASLNNPDEMKRRQAIEELNKELKRHAIQASQYDRIDERLYEPTQPRKDCDRYFHLDTTPNPCDDAKIIYNNVYYKKDAQGDYMPVPSKPGALRLLDFPPAMKCSKWDYRTFKWCPEASYFEPSARVYIDSGEDEPDEVDIFNDGNVNLALDLVTIYFPQRLGRAAYFDAWSFGPFASAGIGQPASDSKDGTKKASSAPVILLATGALFQYKLGEASFGIEIGYMYGASADESLGDSDDSAYFMGIRIDLPKPKK